MKKILKSKIKKQHTFAVLVLLAPLVMIYFPMTTLANEAKNTHENSSSTSLTEQRKKALIHMVKQDCGSCHGMTLKGGLGPALLPENLKDITVNSIKDVIFYGRPGTAMPPWEPILTQQEIIWISQQLKKGLFTQKDTFKPINTTQLK